MMKQIIRLEEAAMFLLGVWAFSLLPFAWWWFLVLILAPDISMVGYSMGDKAGALLYNLFHHKGVAILVFFTGLWLHHEIVELTGIILFSHSSMDRFFGYGLKTSEGFGYTHLGRIGKNKD